MKLNKILNIKYILLGFSMALIGAWINPMNWIENYKGSVSILIYIGAFLTILGSMLFGYGFHITKDEVDNEIK